MGRMTLQHQQVRFDDGLQIHAESYGRDDRD